MREPFTELKETIEDSPDFVSKEFMGFWRKVLEIMEKTNLHDKDSKEYKLKFSQLFEQIVESLKTTEVDRERNLLDELLGADLLQIKEKDLPGKLDDPTSPLGFYKYTSSLKHENAFRIQVPCCASGIEVPLDGRGVTLAYMRNLHKHLPTAEIGLTLDKIIKLGSKDDIALLRNFKEKLSKALDHFKLSFPLIPVLGPPNFYLEGRRFYRQKGIPDYHCCAMTPGAIIPEEYYGEIYRPGMAGDKGFQPGSFIDVNIVGNEKWNKEFERKGSLNPYRPIHKDSSLDRAEKAGSRIHYIVDMEKVSDALGKGIEKWDREKYRKDAINILDYQLSNTSFTLYLTKSLRKAWMENLMQTATAPIRDILEDARFSGPEIVTSTTDRYRTYTLRDQDGKAVIGFQLDTADLEEFYPELWEEFPSFLFGLPEEKRKKLVYYMKKDNRRWQDVLDSPIRMMAVEPNRFKVNGQREKPAETLVDYLLGKTYLKEKVSYIKQSDRMKEEPESFASKSFREEIELQEELDFNQRQKHAVKYIEQRGKITNREYRGLFDVSHDTAYRDLKDLIEKGKVRRKGDGRGSYYELENSDVLSDEKLDIFPGFDPTEWPNCFRDHLGTYLKELRKQRGLTQKEVAEGCNISRDYVSRLELGERKNPSLKVFERLFEFLTDKQGSSKT